MGGQPAARVGDPIACSIPQTTPAALPHAPPAGLPIIPPGAPTVLLSGQPAARIGDMSICIAPAPTPNPIASGSRTVLFGGKPAARKGDLAIHGGSILKGDLTVLVGDEPAGPVFNPALWNDYSKECGDPTFLNPAPTQPEGTIQLSTNCYAYAADNPFGHQYIDMSSGPHTPQPGVAAGAPMQAISVSELQRAAMADGMIMAPGTGIPSAKEGYYIVAGVVDPDLDYHWYRQDSDGTWSHKPGICQAKNKDASGNPITDPEKADRDYRRSNHGPNYSEFAGYFYVPNGGLGMKP